MENVFFHVHPVGVGDRFIVPVSPKFPEMVLRFPPLVLQFIVPHPRNSTKWRCNSHHFDTLKPFGLD